MLLTASKPGKSASYIYDPLGRRSAKTVDATLTSFLHDGVEEVADYNSSGTLLRRYVHGPGVDEYLVMYTGTGTANKSYFHANHQGSIVAMSDSAGNVTEQHSYDSYGNSDELTGNPFRYTGRRLDAETGLYYYRARYYSPAIGRFLQTDPIGYGDGLNWYAYVQNDPMNKNDPSGLAMQKGDSIQFDGAPVRLTANQQQRQENRSKSKSKPNNTPTNNNNGNSNTQSAKNLLTWYQRVLAMAGLPSNGMNLRIGVSGAILGPIANDSGVNGVGQAAEIGVSIPGYNGGEFDIGILSTQQFFVEPSAEIGGKLTVDITSNAGSIREQQGLGADVGLQVLGVGGGLIYGNKSPIPTGARLSFGPGLYLGAAQTQTSIISLRSLYDEYWKK